MVAVGIMSLWQPILLSAVLVFVVSALIHMVLKYHAGDLKPVPDEDKVMAALRPFNIPPGDYMLPRAGSMEAMKSPAFKEKTEKGPVVLMTVMPNGIQGMGGSLLMWFLSSVLISIFSAYIAGRALDPGDPYLQVFRFAGATAFAGYSLGLLQNSIWYKRNWGATLRSMFDGLIYALLTGGVFGWLWPSM